jgi:hypothetical protein
VKYLYNRKECTAADSFHRDVSIITTHAIHALAVNMKVALKQQNKVNNDLAVSSPAVFREQG